MKNNKAVLDLIHFDNNYKCELDFIKASCYPAVIYGAGDYSYDDVYFFLKDYGIDITCHVVDKEYMQLCSASVKNKIINWDELKLTHKKVNLIIGMGSTLMREYKQKDIYENKLMKKYGQYIKNIFWYDVVFYKYFKNLKTYINKNSEYFNTAYSLLCDDLSRKSYIGFINSKISNKPNYISYSDTLQYFPNELIQISENEVFVDCGAYTGDTFADFLQVSNNKYLKYYGWEPDSKNYQTLEKKAKQHPKFIPINYGVWSSYQTMKFSESHGRTDSSIENNGDMSILVDSIDRVCSDATFIKMDIEGAEFEALKGAKNTIINNSPQLAISIYHRPEHLHQIPRYLNEINPHYKFFLRHHNTISNELILYATC